MTLRLITVLLRYSFVLLHAKVSFYLNTSTFAPRYTLARMIQPERAHIYVHTHTRTRTIYLTYTSLCRSLSSPHNWDFAIESRNSILSNDIAINRGTIRISAIQSRLPNCGRNLSLVSYLPGDTRKRIFEARNTHVIRARCRSVAIFITYLRGASCFSEWHNASADPRPQTNATQQRAIKRCSAVVGRDDSGAQKEATFPRRKSLGARFFPCNQASVRGGMRRVISGKSESNRSFYACTTSSCDIIICLPTSVLAASAAETNYTQRSGRARARARAWRYTHGDRPWSHDHA